MGGNQSAVAQFRRQLEVKLARIKSSKIFIKHDDHLCDFMWINIGPDDSVMIGLFAEGDEKTISIISHEGEFKSSDIEHGKSLPNPKINFHKSGICKLTTQIGKTKNSIDRCSILIGTTIDEIVEPKRMMEILIPDKIKISSKIPTEKDIVLDASIFPKKPFRCTVSCMDAKEFQKTVDSNRKFVDTSLCEFIHALEYKEKVWVFTLRVSREDVAAPKNFVFFIPGEIKWGSEMSEI